MKLVLGYIFCFSMAATIAAAMVFGLFLLITGALVFVTWSLPLAPIPWWLIIRICIALGAFLGLLFTFSKEGQEYIKDFQGE